MREVFSHQVLSREETQEKIKQGIDLVVNPVKVTLGRGGMNVLLIRDNLLPVITKDGVSVARNIQHEDPFVNAGAMLVKEVSARTEEMTGDGCQDLNSNILTPYGFKRFGDLKVGDEICGTNGTIQTVEAIYPKGKKQLYRFTFTDKRVTEACDSHVWQVVSERGVKRNFTTKELIESGKVERITNKGFKEHFYYIPNTFVEFKEVEKLQLDPYLLGVLLGDGSLSGTGSVEISLGFKKEHILDKLILPEGITFVKRIDEKKNYIRIRFNGVNKDGKAIKDLLNDLDLMGVKSGTKFIPKSYLYSTLESRKRLLQGLMDTDGYFTNRSLYEYSSISEHLTDDIIELFRSLGKTVTKSVKNRKEGGSYSMTPIFIVSQRKGYKQGIQLKSIEPTDKFVEVQCIKVSNDDSLYITEDYIVTHNTTTSSVLSQSLFNEVQKHKNINPIQLKKDLEKVTEEVVGHLKKLSQKPKSKVRLKEIADISANGDKDVADLVYKAIQKVGETGVIKVEESEDVDSRVEVVDGYQLDTPFYNAGFITNHDKMTAEFSNMNVLLYEGFLESFDDLVPTINAITDFTDPENPRVGGLLILCDTIDPNTENQILNFKSLGHNFMILKTPLYGIQRTELYQDIATLIGAEVYCKEKGKPLTEVTLEGLGKVKKVVSDVNKTLLIGTEGNTSERVNTIKEQLKNYQGASKEKQTIKDRLGKLEGGVAMIYVGGGSKSDKREKTDRVDDALKAVKSCIEEGYVAGAGVTYLTISNMLQGTNEATQVMKEILKAPFLQVYENAGINGKDYLDYVLTAPYGSGIDIDNGEKVNLFDIGVIDPTKVSRLALENAVSVVSLFTSLGASSFNSEPLMQMS